MDTAITIDEFRCKGSLQLADLEAKGFQRTPQFENTSSTFSTLVFVGKHIAFEFSLDVRDQCIDGEIILVQDGKLMRSLDGGYSEDIYTHLVNRERYRGSPSGRYKGADSDSKLSRMLNGWVSLIETAGAKLLNDEEGILD